MVEGTNDIEFLRRISLLLHREDPALPHLAAWEQRGELIFVPFGGGLVSTWTERLAPLGKPEFHLFDHELPPETEYRRAAVVAVNRRPRCQAALTRKRSLENYLHPQAIREARDLDVAFGDFDSVAELAAQQLFERGTGPVRWEALPRAARSRLAYRAKRWLNTNAAECMTLAMLHERDPAGEIRSWMRAIARLARTRGNCCR